MPKKKTKKGFLDYLERWWKAGLALFFFISAGVWVVALAGNVKQTMQRVDEIELSQLNEIINGYVIAYKCYPAETCLLKIKNDEERKIFERVLQDKELILKRMKKGAD